MYQHESIYECLSIHAWSYNIIIFNSTSNNNSNNNNKNNNIGSYASRWHVAKQTQDEPQEDDEDPL